MTKKNRNSKDRQLRLMTSPLSGMTDEEIQELLNSFGQESTSKFDEILPQFQTELLEIDPILLLSSFSYYGLTHDGITPESERSIDILQYHVELLQALLLINDRRDYEFHPIVGNIFKEVQDNLLEISQLFSFKRFGDFSSAQTLAEKKRLSIQEHMRVNTQAIRNWGYPQQIKNTVIKLFEPLDEAIEATYGVRVEYLVEMCYGIIETIEDRINQHTQKLRSVLKVKKIDSLAKQYSEKFPKVVGSQEWLTYLQDNNVTLQQAQFILLSHSDMFLPDLFELTLDDFVIAYSQPVESNNLNKILDSWSLVFGELNDSNIEHFFMANPIWEKPLIKLDGTNYFCPIVGLFISFGVELMENIIRDHEDLWQQYEKRRAEFLEEEIKKLFRENFPNSEIYVGSQWADPQDSSKIYENDLLILFDTTAFVVEAKSGQVRASSRRGAPASLKYDVEKLITDASIQANRFIDFLKEHLIYDFSTIKGEVNHVDISHIKSFQPLNITFDFLGAISAHIPSLQNAGLASSEVKSIPSMSLSDLEIIFELLTNTAQKLHYLSWRTQLEEQTDFFADEIDLLAIYVTDRFSEIQAFGAEYDLNVYGESEIFNPYFLREYHQQGVSKPSRQFTKRWHDTLQRLEDRQVAGWTELSKMLLELPYSEQKKLEKVYKNSRKRLRKSSPENYFPVVISNTTVSIIFLLYRNILSKQVNVFARRFADQTMLEAKTSKAIVVGINFDEEKKHYPYSFIASLFR